MNVISRAKYAEIARKMREIPLEKHGSSYEWDELVEKLCASSDSGLNSIGIRELDLLKYKSSAVNK